MWFVAAWSPMASRLGQSTYMVSTIEEGKARCGLAQGFPGQIIDASNAAYVAAEAADLAAQMAPPPSAARDAARAERAAQHRAAQAG